MAHHAAPARKRVFPADRHELRYSRWELRSSRQHAAQLRGLSSTYDSSRKAAIERWYRRRTAVSAVALGLQRLPRYLRALRTELCVAEARQDWRFALLVLRVLADVDPRGEPPGSWRPPSRKRKRKVLQP